MRLTALLMIAAAPLAALAAAPQDTCLYAGQAYTEGAIVRASDGTLLICARADSRSPDENASVVLDEIPGAKPAAPESAAQLVWIPKTGRRAGTK